LTGLNYEFAYSRGAPPGDYTVNIHMYRNKAKVFPVPVTVSVSLKSPKDTSTRQIMSNTIELNNVGEEATVFRFKLDEVSKLMSGSIHDLPKAIRGGA